ncbi:UNVERIFIED_CONTAM: hypothetical protein GTU68_010309 [Idotea baltica]|nr:hypothetical protein [Idotea baltica]
MKEVKILGTGCPKCKQVTTIVERAIEELKLTNVSIEKIEDIMKIMEYNVMSTPAIVIDGEIRIKGRVPSVSEIKELLQ